MSNYTISIGEYNNTQLDTQHSLVGSLQIYNATSWQQIFYYNGTAIDSVFCQLPTNASSVTAVAFRPSTLDYSVALPILKLRIHPSDVFYNGPCVIRSSEDAADAIQCNIFTKERIETYPVPQYGMMVYDENGKAIFNSDCNILKIQEICQFSLSSLPKTISHNTQNPFYIVPLAILVEYNVIPTSYLPICAIRSFVPGIKKISATQFSINWVLFNLEVLQYIFGVWEDVEEYTRTATMIPNPFRVGLCTL